MKQNPKIIIIRVYLRIASRHFATKTSHSINTWYTRSHVRTLISTSSGKLSRIAKFVKWLQEQMTWVLVKFSTEHPDVFQVLLCKKCKKKMIYNGIPSEMYTSQIKYYITFKNRKFFSFDSSSINLDMK